MEGGGQLTAGACISPLISSPFQNLPAPPHILLGTCLFPLLSCRRREWEGVCHCGQMGPSRCWPGGSALGGRCPSQAARQRGCRGILADCAQPQGSPAAWVPNRGHLAGPSEEDEVWNRRPWVLAAPAQSSAGRVDWGPGSWTAWREEPGSLGRWRTVCGSGCFSGPFLRRVFWSPQDSDGLFWGSHFCLDVFFFNLSPTVQQLTTFSQGV